MSNKEDDPRRQYFPLCYEASDTYFQCPTCGTKSFEHRGLPCSGGYLSGFVWGIELAECCKAAWMNECVQFVRNLVHSSSGI
jgi:hypothetical protein